MKCILDSLLAIAYYLVIPSSTTNPRVHFSLQLKPRKTTNAYVMPAGVSHVIAPHDRMGRQTNDPLHRPNLSPDKQVTRRTTTAQRCLRISQKRIPEKSGHIAAPCETLQPGEIGVPRRTCTARFWAGLMTRTGRHSYHITQRHGRSTLPRPQDVERLPNIEHRSQVEVGRHKSSASRRLVSSGDNPGNWGSPAGHGSAAR